MLFIFNDLELVSINRAKTVARNRIIKTKELKTFQNHVKSVTKASLPGQNFVFDPQKQGIEVKITICVDKDKFFTKKGLISKTSGDIDNGLKFLIDAIFETIGINDAFITSLYVKKVPAKKKGVFVAVDTISL